MIGLHGPTGYTSGQMEKALADAWAEREGAEQALKDVLERVDALERLASQSWVWDNGAVARKYVCTALFGPLDNDDIAGEL